MMRTYTLLALIGLVACNFDNAGKRNEFHLLIASLGVDAGIIVASTCTPRDSAPVVFTKETCIDVAAGTTDVSVPVAYDGKQQTMTCTFSVTMYDRCDEPRSIMMTSSFTQLLWANERTNPASTSGFTDVVQAYDDDGDGISNYKEVATGSDPRSANASSCQAKTCTQLNAVCKGSVDNGCGAMIDCGASESDAAFCARVNSACGVTSNNALSSCGGGPKSVQSCGTCAAPMGCVSNQCVCLAEDITVTCANKNCGMAMNNCGDQVACGTCQGQTSCGGSGTANVCGSVYDLALWSMPDSRDLKCINKDSDQLAIGVCPAMGEANFGQDGSYATVPAARSLSVLAAAPDNGNTVADNTTGRVWFRAPLAATSWDDANQQCQSSTAYGSTEWRLPSAIELVSIVDYSIDSAVALAVDDTVFDTTTTPALWSTVFWSQTYKADDSAITVSLRNGKISSRSLSSTEPSVLCVRDALPALAPTPRYSTNASALHDFYTGLSWELSTTSSGWTAALSHCEGLSLDGHTDWRLPNLPEALSLLDWRKDSPSHPSSLMAAASANGVWSSTPNGHWLAVPLEAFSVTYDKNSPANIVRAFSIATTAAVRCVRGP